MNLDEYRYLLLKNPFGDNISVQTWNDGMSMILHQSENGKVVMSYSQLEQLVKFVNDERACVPSDKISGLTQRALDVCPAVTDGIHLWTVNGVDKFRTCKHCGKRQ